MSNSLNNRIYRNVWKNICKIKTVSNLWFYVVKCSFDYKLDVPNGFSEILNKTKFTLRFRSLHCTKRYNFETMSCADAVGCKLNG